MPQAILRKLVLTKQENGGYEVLFTYRATFTFAEMQMTKCGMTYRDRVYLIGVDPPGSTTGTIIPIYDFEHTFGEFHVIPVSAWDGIYPRPSGIGFDRTFAGSVTRAQLDEDPSHPFLSPDFDPDELRCRVEITSRQEPVELATIVRFSNEEVIGERVNTDILVFDAKV